MSHSQPAAHESSWIALRYPGFRRLYFTEFMINVGASMQLAAVGWQIWRMTKDELALGNVGLVRVIPIVLLALFGGVIADASDRRKLLIRTHSLTFVLAGVLSLASFAGNTSTTLIYAITALLAGLLAFESPARTALLPMLVPAHHLAHATRITSMLFPVTTVIGPMLAGIALSLSGEQFGVVYGLNALLALPAMLILARLKLTMTRTGGGWKDVNFRSMKEGLSFVWRIPELRGSMLLDFFATFFSSALALLPVYSTEVLHTDTTGYGILLAAPSIGSIIGAFTMTQLGARVQRQGEVMLWAVGAYGLVTIIFGVSQVYWLSFLALMLTGLTDSISAVVRSTMRQLLTPNHLRGRMISVNMIFYMGGPQLGEFEAGWLAKQTSPEFSVVFGGIGTILVVGFMAATIPSLRTYREVNAIRVATTNAAAAD